MEHIRPSRWDRRLLEPAPLAVAGQMDGQKRRDLQIGRRPMVAVMAKTGLRVTELCQLRWRAVDVHHERLIIDQAKTDAGKRQVDLTLDVVDELNSWRAESDEVRLDGFVFATASGKPRNKDNVRTILSRVVTRANEQREDCGQAPLPHVVPHTLRRTYISLMLEAGAPLHYVMDQVGWLGVGRCLGRAAETARSRNDLAPLDEVHAAYCRLVHSSATASRFGSSPWQWRPHGTSEKATGLPVQETASLRRSTG